MTDDRLARNLWLSSAVVNLISLGLAVALSPRQTNFLPLHYTIYFGTDLTGHWLKILFLPGLGAAILISHALIGLTVDDAVWRRSWMVLAVTLELLLLATLAALLVWSRSNL